MVHPATEINKCIAGEGTDLTIRNIASRLATKCRKQFESLWLALPTSRNEEMYAFIYLQNPTMANIASKIQEFYQLYIGLSADITDNGPMSSLIYPEGATNGDDMDLGLYGYESEKDPVVVITFGS